MPRGTHENSLRNLKPARPGEERSPAGRKTASATIKEHLNALAERNLAAKQLCTIARDDTEAWPRRAAAERILRTLETGDCGANADHGGGHRIFTLCSRRGAATK